MGKTGHNLNCLQCAKSFYVPGWALKKGRGKYCTMKCYQIAEKGRINFNIEGLKLGHGWNKGIPNPRIQGSNHPMWKGGITPETRRLRNSMEYKIWREEVFKRDNWTCVLCGDRSKKTHPVILNADHIKPWSLYPELRFDITNGRTLCKDCHMQTPTYMNRWHLEEGNTVCI